MLLLYPTQGNRNALYLNSRVKGNTVTYSKKIYYTLHREIGTYYIQIGQQETLYPKSGKWEKYFKRNT